jgi:hypothetical protein
MILVPRCDGCLGPVHVLGLWRHDSIYLSFILEITPLVLLRSGEDVVVLDDGRIVILALVCR